MSEQYDDVLLSPFGLLAAVCDEETMDEAVDAYMESMPADMPDGNLIRETDGRACG